MIPSTQYSVSATDLTELLRGTPYVSYTYAYPHKTAYRVIDPPVDLDELWAGEKRDSLSLYMHIPFCEMRCGFCNLFTTANPREGMEEVYLQALHRQALMVSEAVGEATVARMAIGGGTPTYLGTAQLERLLDMAEGLFGVNLVATPISVETSPGTADPEKLTILRARGVDRISIGVQSFLESEVRAAGRAQNTAEVEKALSQIREAGFPTLNIDLIYGLPGQTVESWLRSLYAALVYGPEELYLYPLYTRPLTGLSNMSGPKGGSTDAWHDIRLECYRTGRAVLLAAGYEQVSMRMFRVKTKADAEGKAILLMGESTSGDHLPLPSSAPLAYCCQEDGMVGIGCGARSYTHALHYSGEYAVSRRSVRAILQDYVTRPQGEFKTVNYGYRLNMDDQRRRYLIQSVLQKEGLARDAYRARFGTEATEDYPELVQLVEVGLATLGDSALTLTEQGLEWSDVIGPWLYSERVRQCIARYELR
jgi:oxygen-independent coproporphyrinogen-3 oxidase